MTHSDQLSSQAPNSEFVEGWPVILAAALGTTVSLFPAVAVAAMMKMLATQNGWSRADISGGAFVISLGMLVFGPLVGSLIDRFGPRRIALIGVPCHAAVLFVFGLAGPSLWAWYTVCAIMAVASATVSPVVWTMAVISRFDRRRGFALGLSMGGLALTNAVVPAFMVATARWGGIQGAFHLLALVELVTVFPVAWLFFRSAADLGPRAATDRARLAAPPAHEGMTFREALHTPRFWFLALIMIVAAGAGGLFVLHLQPILTDGGLSPMEAAFARGAIGPALLVGRIGGGALLDRVFAPFLVSGMLFVLLLAVIAILAGPMSMPRGVAVALLVGVSLGAEVDCIAFVVSRYFGTQHFATIYGMLFGLFSLGYGLGPLVGGLVFDKFGSYFWVLGPFAGLLTVAMVVALLLGPYPANVQGRGTAESIP